MANKNLTLPNSINTGTLIVDNITLPADTYARTIIYVRPTGNDTTGDGSSSSPFRTLQFALNTIPQLQASGSFYMIDVTGINDTVSDPIVFPSFLPSTPGQFSTDFLPFVDDQYVTVYAQPNVLATLNAGTTSTPDGYTGMLILTVPGASFTVDGYKNNYIMGPGFFDFGVIISNTATTITTTCLALSDLTQLKIASEGAVFTADTDVASTFEINSVKAGIAFDSIAIAHTDSIGCSIDGQLNDYLGFYMCSMKNLFLGNSNIINAYASYISGTSAGDAVADNVIESVSQTYNGCIFYSTSPIINSGVFTGCYMDTCRWLEDVGNYVVASCAFNGYGLIVEAGTNVVLSDCRFDNCASMPHLNVLGSGIVIDGGSITFAEGIHFGHSSNMGGINNAGYGVELRGGGNAWLQSGHTVNFTVSGTLGELKCGNKPARTWSNFNSNNPILTENDPFGQMTYIGQNTDTTVSNINYDGYTQTIVDNGIGTGSTRGLSLQNNTTATSAAPVQNSPALEFISHQYLSGGTGDVPAKIKVQLEPGDGGTKTYNKLGWYADCGDGAGYTEQAIMTIGQPGASNLFGVTTGAVGLQLYESQATINYGGYSVGVNSAGVQVAGLFTAGNGIASNETSSNHYYGAGSAPTIAVNASSQLGTGGSVSITGLDADGYVKITTGTTPAVFTSTTAILVATITFNGTMTHAPRSINLNPGNQAANIIAMPSSTAGGIGFFVDAASMSTTTWKIYMSTKQLTSYGTLPASTSFVFFYQVMG